MPFPWATWTSSPASGAMWHHPVLWGEVGLTVLDCKGPWASGWRRQLRIAVATWPERTKARTPGEVDDQLEVSRVWQGTFVPEHWGLKPRWQRQLRRHRRHT